MPLHEDSTSYVRCLSPSEVLHNEIYRLTDCFVSCSSGSYIKYILFLVCKGGRKICVRLNGYISTLSAVFQQQQINGVYGVPNYLPSDLFCQAILSYAKRIK